MTTARNSRRTPRYGLNQVISRVALFVVLFMALFISLFICPALVLNALPVKAVDVSTDTPDYNLALLSQTSVSSGQARDLWGWVDTASGAEYVLLCVGVGLEIYDIGLPNNPVLVETVPSVGADLKDVKTFGRYCYAVNQVGALQVIDLSTLPDSAVTVGLFQAPDIPGSHNIFVDSLTGYAYLGMNGAGGDIRMFDLSDPVNPQQAGVLDQRAFLCQGGNDETHDVWCYNDTCYFAGLDAGLIVVDVSDKLAPELVTIHRYQGNFTHNVWGSSDRAYLFTTDERPNGHLRVFDVRDPERIRQVASYQAAPSTIIHNVHIRDSLAFVSYYGEGLRVLNVSDPTAPVEIAAYDTYPQGGGTTFNGCWGVFPYFPSGVVACSDRSNGLILLSLVEEKRTWLEGIVTEQSGAAVPGARLTVEGSSAVIVSAQDGSFRLASPGRKALITVLRAGYRTHFENISSAGSSSTAFNPVLIPHSGAKVTVRVNALEGPEVHVSVANQVIGEIQTDQEGLANLGNLPAGTQLIAAYGWGYLPADTAIEIESSSQEVSLTLRRGYQDNFEWDQGWKTGTASTQSGVWERAVPYATFNGASPVQPGSDHGSGSDRLCWLTGFSLPGALKDEADIDGGTVTLYSPLLDLSDYQDPHISYWRWFTNDQGFSVGQDSWLVSLSADSGRNWKNLEFTLVSDASWSRKDFRVRNYFSPSKQMMLRFVVTDDCLPSTVEAALDDFSVYDDYGGCCDLPADANGDNRVTISDALKIVIYLFQAGAPGPCVEEMDVNGSGEINIADIIHLINVIFSSGPAPVCPGI